MREVGRHTTWNQFFMEVAEAASRRSKDPNTQVGACIVNDKNRITGVGYNGFPNGCEDDEFPWDREGPREQTKYPYVVHAELNAILNQTSLTGTTIYCTVSPCEECAKAIIQAGIKRVYYKTFRFNKATERMFWAANVIMREVDEPSANTSNPVTSV